MWLCDTVRTFIRLCLVTRATSTEYLTLELLLFLLMAALV